MKLYQRDGYWYVEFSVRGDPLAGVPAKRYRKSTKETNRTDAQEAAVRIIGKYSAGSQPGGMTVTQWVDQYIERAGSEKWLKPNTLAWAVAPRLKLFKDQFGDRKLSSIAAGEILQWVERQPVSASTKRGYYRVLRAWLSKDRRFGFIHNMPLQPEHAGTLPRPEKPQIDILTDEETALLLAASWQTSLEPAILLGLCAGLRVGEIMHADWEDIDRDRQVIRIRKKSDWTPKSHEEREIPLARPLQTFIGRKRLKGPILRTPDNKRYTHRPRKPMEALCESAGIRQIGWHILRHTFATNLLLSGATLYQVSRLLGHSSVRVTESAYAHVAARDLADVIGLI